MMTSFLLIFAMGKAAFQEPLSLLEEPEFGCADLARAANHFIQLGEVAGPVELKKLFREVARKPFLERGVDRPERLGWICRMVFTSKDQVPLGPAPSAC